MGGVSGPSLLTTIGDDNMEVEDLLDEEYDAGDDPNSETTGNSKAAGTPVPHVINANYLFGDPVIQGS